jgi:hypothetical protein
MVCFRRTPGLDAVSFSYPKFDGIRPGFEMRNLIPDMSVNFSTLYPEKLPLTLPRSCCRSVGIVRSRTQAKELLFEIQVPHFIGQLHLDLFFWIFIHQVLDSNLAWNCDNPCDVMS